MLLRFDFGETTRCFSNPVEIIQTSQLTEVLNKLSYVEQQVNTQGYYAAGFISYEAAAAFDPHLITQPASELPLLWFALFKDETPTPKKRPTTQPKPLTWHSKIDYARYQVAINEIHAAIARGDTYQVNYTLQLNTEFKQATRPFYDYLTQAQQAQYTAYLELGDYTLMSASPELFFHRKQQQIIAKPMKGTMPRGLDYFSDQQQKNKLAESIKDQAENVMIVDLLRNDLNKISEAGSVTVEKLFELESYPTVWQMTSTISAKLRQNCSLVDIFQALFPCGSITGAPKASTMQLIAQLEQQPRGVYCGAIGYLTPQKEAIFNVPIRTVVVNHTTQQASYGVGGGITWDSDSHLEFQEVLDKSKVLKEIVMPNTLLESLLLEKGEYWLLERHLQRLQHSAHYFNFNYSEQTILQALQQFATDYPTGQWKVRLLLPAHGKLTLSATPIAIEEIPLQASWSPYNIRSNFPLLYHKTTTRDHYPLASLAHEYLLYNEREEMTEFVNGNIVLRLNDKWLTPALSSGLLNGVFRQELLENGVIQESVLPRSLLKEAEEIMFINSVRGWRRVEFNF